MGCGCSEVIKTKRCYDHVKELASKYANYEKVVVVIYKVPTGGFDFVELDTPEADRVTPYEYIYPLQ